MAKTSNKKTKEDAVGCVFDIRIVGGMFEVPDGSRFNSRNKAMRYLETLVKTD